MTSLTQIEDHILLGEILVRNKMPWMSLGIPWQNQETFAEVKRLFPYLCDDNVKLKDGQFEWQHYTRFAQQRLKDLGVLEKVNPDLKDGLWVKVRE